MLSRHSLIVIGSVALTLMAPGMAVGATTWSVSGAGRAAGNGGSLAPPSNVSISSCTGTKGSGSVTGTVTITWTVSTTAAATGQIAYIGSGSPTTYASNSTFSNNTTATAILSYSSLVPATYKVGIAASRGAIWVSPIAGSTDSFTPSTAGPSGGCGHA
jgi:hypothetical protein